MEHLEGKYQHERSENFDEFLKAIGVPLIPRKLMLTSKPDVEVVRDGDRWTIRMLTLIKTIEYAFTPGEVVKSETMGGLAENVFSVEGSCIRQTQKSANYTTEIVREFSQEGLAMTLTHVESGTVCHRYFKRI
ncbi:fatty acid-binding protein [Procambarus clarkii]|uniref:fatty acid-binding protein n=1 Tax=Procambarus clarkii TaxID=6728 RepID=UPI001E676B4D|nr:sodium/calcium exchanger regulatory protein 1-like [Procambarus clarkii]